MCPNPYYRHGMQLLGGFLLFHSLHNWDNNSKLKYTEWLTEWEVKFNTLKERISNLLKNLLTLPEEVSSVAQANKHLVDLPTSYVHDNCIYHHLFCFKKITHTRYQCPAVSTSLLEVSSTICCKSAYWDCWGKLHTFFYHMYEWIFCN